jgi:hypothetical protein
MLVVASLCILASFASNPDNIKDLLETVKRDYPTENDEIAGSKEAQKLTESSTTVGILL